MSLDLYHCVFCCERLWRCFATLQPRILLTKEDAERKSQRAKWALQAAVSDDEQLFAHPCSGETGIYWGHCSTFAATVKAMKPRQVALGEIAVLRQNTIGKCDNLKVQF